VLYFFLLLLRRTPSSPLFPYTTLFRSGRWGLAAGRRPAGLVPGRARGQGRDEAERGAGQARARRLRDLEPAHHNRIPERPRHQRSEEHTSELQSQSNLVCRLLLEKKKK